MLVICGCGASFKRSGIRNHQRQSDNPRCKRIFVDPGDMLDNSENQPENEGNQPTASENEPIEADETEWKEDFNVDPTGDFFGNYDDYTPEEFGLDPEEELEENPTHGSDSDSDEEEEGADSLEPSRIPRTSESTPIIDEAESSGTPTSGASRMRGGAETELKKKPYVVKFSKGKAGATYTNQDCVDQNTAYTSQIGNQENPFNPFRSKVEWEIALWAKTRGPSSTAFTELMSIEGVSEMVSIRTL
jgi:hypothetical protein